MTIHISIEDCIGIERTLFLDFFPMISAAIEMFKQRFRTLMFNTQTHIETPDSLDPFATLNIIPDALPQEVKNAFKSQICSPNRHQRAMVALAYDMICSTDSQKYTRDNNIFHVQRKDLFYYVNTGNYELFAEHLKTSNVRRVDSLDPRLKKTKVTSQHNNTDKKYTLSSFFN